MTQELLKSILHYEPLSGIFTWLIKPNYSTNIGDEAGRLSRYIQIQYKNKKYYAHRLAWLYTYGTWPKFEIDHINQVKIDNRIINLRDVTRSVNLKNITYKSRNGQQDYYINYIEHKNRWVLTASRSLNNGGKRYCGSFNTKKEAITAKQRLVSPNNGDTNE